MKVYIIRNGPLSYPDDISFKKCHAEKESDDFDYFSVIGERQSFSPLLVLTPLSLKSDYVPSNTTACFQLVRKFSTQAQTFSLMP